MSDETEGGLGEPVFTEYTEDLRRTKRNLLIVSSVAILAHLSGVQTEAKTFLGLTFSGLEQIWLQTALFFIVVYLFVQFVWQMWIYIQYNRLRITGMG